MSELGCCTNAEATFPLPPDTRPIDRAPYRANPRAKAVIDKCVHDTLEWDIIEERPSPWGSPCTLVAKKNGSPRFCVDYRHTLNRHIVRKSWPLPNLDSCLDAVGGQVHLYSRCPQRVLAITRRRGAHRPDSIRHSDRQVMF